MWKAQKPVRARDRASLHRHLAGGTPGRGGYRGLAQGAAGTAWEAGVCATLGVGDPTDMWRRVLGAVSSYADLETPLLGAVERLIDWMTEPAG